MYTKTSLELKTYLIQAYIKDGYQMCTESDLDNYQMFI